MAKALDLVGAQTCRQGTAAYGTLVGVAGVNYSEGCEQLSVMASAIDVSQRVFNCAIQSFSRTVNTVGSATYTVNMEVGDGFEAANCQIAVLSVVGVEMASYSKFTVDQKTALNNTLDQSMKTFATALQEDKKTGLFNNAEGQKALSQFSQAVENVVDNGSLTSIVSKNLVKFEVDSTITLKVGKNARFQYITAKPGQNCIVIDSTQVISLISQTIIDEALDTVFSNDLSQDLKTVLLNSNDRTTEGFTLPNISLFAILGVVAVIIVVLMFVPKLGAGAAAGGGPPRPILAGNTAKIFGIVLLVIGLLLIVAGTIVLILKKNTVLGIGLLVGGAIFGAIGLTLFLKAKSQEAMYKQQVDIARAGAAQSSIVINTPPVAAAAPAPAPIPVVTTATPVVVAPTPVVVAPVVTTPAPVVVPPTQPLPLAQPVPIVVAQPAIPAPPSSSASLSDIV
jgi:hypothetical protein